MARHTVLVIIIVIAAVLAAGYFYFDTRDRAPVPAPDIGPVGATLLEGLGDYSMPVTSDHPEVQRWFDQALMLTYGFNHDAAERSYLRATELDPECAMCWWGAALVLGPHVNAGMDPANNAKAWERLQRARNAAHASERERAYIEALTARFVEHPPADRMPLDLGYAEAMEALSHRYPDDVDAATLYAEAMMNLQPWDFWDDQGRPKGKTPDIIRVLESVMARAPDHAGALHLYIHAVEASDAPERGAAAADRLRGLIPGSGHLVHMPAHIYARVGRWHDAALVNKDAIVSDDLYLATCRPAPGIYPLGYVPHNHHFLWFAATMSGDSATALAAAAETGRRTGDPDLMRMPGMEGMQHFALTPLYAMVRFGLWNDVADFPRPANDLPFQVAIWHYAQGMAALRQERLDIAASHYGSLLRVMENPDIAQMMIWDRYSVVHVVEIAERTLAAELAVAEGDVSAAIEALRQAIRIEDAIPYDEPPGWHAPVRQTLGAVLIDAGRGADAEAVYREELRRNPENGWSLYGLAEALAMQGRAAESAAARARFDAAWAHADVELLDSRF